MVLESANLWLVVSVRSDWHQTSGLDSAALARQAGDLLFSSKAGFGLPMILLVEDDIDITDVDHEYGYG
jgi:hypothetical protein